jgi:transaldolase
VYDVLRPVHETTAEVAGRVSIQVDPQIAHDTQRTVAEARGAWWLVDRPNLFINIAARPAGPAGDHRLPGREDQHQRHADLLASPIRQVIEAFLTGMEQARAAGRDLSGITPVASFFVSRVDTEVGPAAGQDRHRAGSGAARQGRHRQRPARYGRHWIRPPTTGWAA